MIVIIIVTSYNVIWVCFADYMEVFPHMVHESTFRLAYILYVTSTACDAVYEIITLASYIALHNLIATSMAAGDAT